MSPQSVIGELGVGSWQQKPENEDHRRYDGKCDLTTGNAFLKAEFHVFFN